MKNPILSLLCIWCLPLLPQERFAAGEMEGFTKLPTEHIIERLGEQAPLRMIDGVVISKSLSKPMPRVLVEIRGPGPSEDNRSAVSARNGRFKFQGVSKGEDAIKITCDGFRSVFGRVSVQPWGKPGKPLRIEMLDGV